MTSIRPPARAGRKKRNNGEERAQKCVIEWAAWIRIPPAPDIEPGAKIKDYLFAIPNGGSRNAAEAGNLKAQGTKAGVWDLMLPIARGGYHGLWVEMKYGKNNLSDSQEEWGERMRLAGYLTAVAYSSIEAQTEISNYLGLKIP